MSTIVFGEEHPALPPHNSIAQPLWQRIILLIVLGYEGAGALLGGGFLIAAPDGHLMQMPTYIMNGAFPDFRIPGFILFGLGLLNIVAFVSVLRRTTHDWLIASVALAGLFIWFSVEIALLQQVHWLHAMWGLPVLFGCIAAISLARSRDVTWTQALLICGIVSSLFYVGMNFLVPMLWRTYDPASQTVSELSAIGAPTRTLWVVLGTVYTLLVFMCGVGVWKRAGTNLMLRSTGELLVMYSLASILWPIFPMHLRETLAAGGATWSDTMHIVLANVTVLLMFATMVFGARALGLAFRAYTIITIALLVVFGVMTFMEAPNVGLNRPTPMIGVWERLNIGVFMAWIVVLTAKLLNTSQATTAIPMGKLRSINYGSYAGREQVAK